jgi:nucleoside-diphosphate-sugar epimerase
MHILILGGAGMVGRKLVERLAHDGHLGGREITRVTLHDVVEAQKPAGASFETRTAVSDFALPGEAERLVAERPDVIFHLAAIVSGEAEADFDKGYRINLDGTRYLFDAIRLIGDGYKPRVVFTSSIAVFGAPFRRRSATSSSPLRLRAMGCKRRSASCFWPITPAAASSTASASACPRSACGRASPTRRHPASSQISSANR